MPPGSRTPHATNQRPGLTLAALTAAATLAAAALWLSGSPAFAPYLGPLPPPAATLICGAAGGGALAWLRRADWLPDRRPGFTATTIALLASGFAALTIATDLAAPYPRDINVPLPAALLFYPAVGFVAEIVFHLVPFALLLALFTASGLPRRAALLAALPLTAALEPAFQVIAGAGTGPLWRDMALALHLFGFGLVQLTLLRRNGFTAMLAFRLVYYLLWHVLWGTARLGLLF